MNPATPPRPGFAGLPTGWPLEPDSPRATDPAANDTFENLSPAQSCIGDGDGDGDLAGHEAAIESSAETPERTAAPESLPRCTGAGLQSALTRRLEMARLSENLGTLRLSPEPRTPLGPQLERLSTEGQWVGDDDSPSSRRSSKRSAESDVFADSALSPQIHEVKRKRASAPQTQAANSFESGPPLGTSAPW